jgi:hypothetical protein
MLRPSSETISEEPGSTSLVTRWIASCGIADAVEGGFDPCDVSRSCLASPEERVDFVFVHSDNSGIRIGLDIEPIEHPQTVY